MILLCKVLAPRQINLDQVWSLRQHLRPQRLKLRWCVYLPVRIACLQVRAFDLRRLLRRQGIVVKPQRILLVDLLWMSVGRCYPTVRVRHIHGRRRVH